VKESMDRTVPMPHHSKPESLEQVPHNSHSRP
jgi:hypothetical protein